MGRASNLAAFLLEDEVRDFISQNPLPYRLQPFSSDIWEIYLLKDDGTEQDAGKLYFEDNPPPEAHQYWRDNPWVVVPERFHAEMKAFPSQQLAIDYALAVARQK